MKKKWIILLLALTMVLSGCGQGNVGEAASVGNVEKSEIEAGSMSEREDESVGGSKVSGEEKSGADSDQRPEESSSTEADGDHGEAAEPTDIDEVTQMKEYLKELKRVHNEEELDFTPRIEEFCMPDEEGLDMIPSPEGECYGFYDDLTAGCSVWCAVSDYKVSVEASSTLAPQGTQDYEAANLLTGTRDCGWVEGVDGNGIEENIHIYKTYDVDLGEEYDQEESIFFYELCIVNGLARNEKTWRENGRVKTMDFYYCDTYMGTLELADTMKPQFISLSGLNMAAKNHEKVDFMFQIKEVYPGEKYEDTALTGIEIAFDTPNH